MDQYQRLKLLGRGSYGSALLVREKLGGNRLRVVKEIDLERIPEKAREGAKNEIRVLRSLQHPNIVGYFDGFQEGTKLCIVMEFADAGDLADSIKRKRDDSLRFEEAEVTSIVGQCGCGLSHVHRNHVLHRDLKCQNIFMTKAGVAKLGDFGISKILEETAAEAITFIGTPVYLAPEVCNGESYGTKADVWSLGIVMYELLQLTPPFKADNIGALMMKILHAEPAAVDHALYSSGIRSLVAKLLSKDPSCRPHSRELLDYLGVEDPHQPSPSGAAESREKVKQSDLAVEFHKNRAVAAMARLRAESGIGEPGPGSVPLRSPHPPAVCRRRSGQDQEESHLRALQEASAQTRRDARNVRLKILEMERAEAATEDVDRRCVNTGSRDVESKVKLPSSVEPLSAPNAQRSPSPITGCFRAVGSDNSRRFQELKIAAAQAVQERRQLQERHLQRLQDPGQTDFVGPSAQESASSSGTCHKRSPSAINGVLVFVGNPSQEVKHERLSRHGSAPGVSGHGKLMSMGMSRCLVDDPMSPAQREKNHARPGSQGSQSSQGPGMLLSQRCANTNAKGFGPGFETTFRRVGDLVCGKFADAESPHSGEFSAKPLISAVAQDQKQQTHVSILRKAPSQPVEGVRKAEKFDSPTLGASMLRAQLAEALSDQGQEKEISSNSPIPEEFGTLDSLGSLSYTATGLLPLAV